MAHLLQIESSVVLKPFFMKLTTSELHAIMTSGFATVAGSMFAATIEFGVGFYLLAMSLFFCLFLFDSLRPIYNLSVIEGQFYWVEPVLS